MLIESDMWYTSDKMDEIIALKTLGYSQENYVSISFSDENQIFQIKMESYNWDTFEDEKLGEKKTKVSHEKNVTKTILKLLSHELLNPSRKHLKLTDTDFAEKVWADKIDFFKLIEVHTEKKSGPFKYIFFLGDEKKKFKFPEKIKYCFCFGDGSGLGVTKNYVINLYTDMRITPIKNLEDTHVRENMLQSIEDQSFYDPELSVYKLYQQMVENGNA